MFANNRRDAFAVYLLLQGGQAVFYTLVFTLNIVYFVTVLDLTPLQLVLVGTVLETSVFLFEVPTGVVADVYSRRLSIIIGLLLLGSAFIVMGAIPVYAAVLISQVIWGIGYTFTSGATEAWIADEIGEDRAGNAFVRGSQAGSVGSQLGILGAVGLAALGGINTPIIVGGILFVFLGLLLIVIMPETGFQRTPAAERDTWSEMFGTFRAGLGLIRQRPVLITILIITVIHGVASEGYDRLWQKHLIDSITLPGVMSIEIWFGALSVMSMVLGLGFQEVARRRVDLNDPTATARAAMLLNLGIALGILVLALTTELGIALIAIILIGPLRHTAGPIYTAWINQSLEPNVRATVLSMSGQVDALGQIAGGPTVGLIGNQSVRAALTFSAVIWAAATPLYRRTWRTPDNNV